MIRWLRDPNRAGLLMFLAILTLLSAAALLLAGPVKADAPAEMDGQQGASSQASEVEAMIAHLVAIAPRHPMNRLGYGIKLAERLTWGAEKYDIPVALITAMAYRESSFRWDVIGPGGEIGVMQVHPGTVKKFKCDMSNVESQINCGCEVLAWHHDRCGSDWRAALAAYGSKRAECNPKAGSKLRRMVDDRFQLADELRGIVDK